MFREILNKALGRDAQKADIAQMIVLIDYKPMFCDYANFSKYDPDWWMELADDVKQNSAKPDLALGLYAIAASQYFFEGPHRSMGKTKEALMKAMSFRKEHPVVMTIGKAVMLSEIGNLEEAPTREDMVKDGLDSANAQIELYERLVTEDLD
jgi:hypothetical protein